MQLEAHKKSEESVTFNFPPAPVRDPVKHNEKHMSFSRRMIESKHNDQNNLIFQKTLEFDDIVSQLVMTNFQLVKKSHYSFFLHLIIYPPANMDEKVYLFAHAEASSQALEDTVNYTMFPIKNAATTQEYLNCFMEIKADLLSKRVKAKRNILCVFDAFVRFSAENFEKLIILLNEEVISSLPDYKFCLLVSVIEGHQYSFQIKNMYLEKTPYFSFGSIFSEFLFKIFKGSSESYMFFSPDFFKRAVQHNQDYLGTLQNERQKWEIYKRLSVFKNKEAIDKFENDKVVREVIEASYRRFKFAIKMLYRLIEIGAKKSETEVSILIMNFVVSGFNELPLNLHQSFRNYDDLLATLRHIIDKEHYSDKFRGDNDWARRTDAFWKAVSGATAGPSEARATSAKGGFGVYQVADAKDRVDKIQQLFSQGKSPLTENWVALKKTVLNMFQSIVESHYKIVRDRAPFLLVDNYHELSVATNPDFYGSWYSILYNYNSPQDALFIVKCFFDVLKTRPEKCTVQEVLFAFQQLLKKHGSEEEDYMVDAFMYCQHLFEHLHFSKMTHKAVYFLEKNFFAKYVRKA